MPVVTSYAQGTPCWVDLQTPDPQGASAFYSKLFSWDIRPADDAPEYLIAYLKGKAVAAITVQEQAVQDAGVPPVWSVYLAVDNADETAAKVSFAGGTLVMDPMDAGENGRFFFALDPQGAVIAFWQAGKSIGAELVNETGAVVWNELLATDPVSVQRFYQETLGVDFTQEGGEDADYWLMKVKGQEAAGLMKQPVEGLPPFWGTYFNVESLSESIELAESLGAEVHVPPTDLGEVGSFAMLGDPQGAVFCIHQFAEGHNPENSQ